MARFSVKLSNQTNETESANLVNKTRLANKLVENCFLFPELFCLSNKVIYRPVTTGMGRVRLLNRQNILIL